MIMGEQVTGTLKLLEKASSRHHIYEVPFLKTIIDKFLLSKVMRGARRGTQVVPEGPTQPSGADGPPAREHGVWWPWPTGVDPLSHTSTPRNPKT